MKNIYLTPPILVVVLFFLAFLFTDNLTTYEVTGRLIDSDSNAVAGLTVLLLNEQDHLLASGQSNDQGRFLLSYQAEAASVDPFDDLQGPSEFRLGSSYPNPFNPVTTIPFHAPEATQVVIGVYDILGRQVIQTQAGVGQGTHHIVVNLGPGLSQGQYLLRVRGNGFALVQGMTFISAGVSSGSAGIRVRPAGGQERVDIAPRLNISDETATLRLLMEDTDDFLQRQVQIPFGQDYDSGELLLTRKRYIQGDGVTDIEGNEYRTVIIGDQEWMAENLRTTRYQDDTEIASGLSDTDWRNTTSGAMAVQPHGSLTGLNSDEDVMEVYGPLYNWYAVSATGGLCPADWRVPTEDDWNELMEYVASFGYPNTSIANGAGNALKSRRQEESPLGAPWDTFEHPRWRYHFTHHGRDVFGFSGHPGGYRLFNGTFDFVGAYGYWWSSSESSQTSAWSRNKFHGSGDVSRLNLSKQFGFSVRCIRE
ncbi:MAG: T9SS C-terminal target domain-containing protein [Balneolaceae bacterium]|nr:MAG: T9SS C-terminal target domain-containing protein [Balneolaceae bacterium]